MGCSGQPTALSGSTLGLLGTGKQLLVQHVSCLTFSESGTVCDSDVVVEIPHVAVVVPHVCWHLRT